MCCSRWQFPLSPSGVHLVDFPPVLSVPRPALWNPMITKFLLSGICNSDCAHLFWILVCTRLITFSSCLLLPFHPPRIAQKRDITVKGTGHGSTYTWENLSDVAKKCWRSHDVAFQTYPSRGILQKCHVKTFLR